MDNSAKEKKILLCRAISDKRIVQFKYDGRSRIVEPFCCGLDAAKNSVLRGFQIRGSDKTKPLCWRLYELSAISQLSITRHEFMGKREGYHPDDPAISEIFAKIS